jgi:hypothetical protein
MWIIGLASTGSEVNGCGEFLCDQLILRSILTGKAIGAARKNYSRKYAKEILIQWIFFVIGGYIQC